MSQQDAGQAQPPVNVETRRNFSEEMAEWFRLLREHWFQDSEKTWSRKHQFFFTFLGSFSFFVMLPVFTWSTGNVEFQTYIFSDVFVVLTMYLIATLASGFFGVMLAWLPRKTGPTRLYLSGVALPSLVLFIASFPFRYGMVS